MRSAGGKAEEKGSGTRGGGALSTLLRRAHRKSPEPGSKREEAVYTVAWKRNGNFCRTQKGRARSIFVRIVTTHRRLSNDLRTKSKDSILSMVSYLILWFRRLDSIPSSLDHGTKDAWTNYRGMSKTRDNKAISPGTAMD